ncbi:jg25594 [Pararge aegeria aegeria]|uniref:Jg25594 protein n=1 Tax=Pararge aegeria aegeria TaxID=348720 RepID=A0A8S4QD16_9NEOP|nr:jg25594 [Pararge aegeria aegeria]
MTCTRKCENTGAYSLTLIVTRDDSSVTIEQGSGAEPSFSGVHRVFDQGMHKEGRCHEMGKSYAFMTFTKILGLGSAFVCTPNPKISNNVLFEVHATAELNVLIEARGCIMWRRQIN